MNVSSDFKQDAAWAYPIDRSPRAQQFVHSPRAFPCWNSGLCLVSYALCEAFQIKVCPLCLAFCETAHFSIRRAPLVVLKMEY